jgi:ribosome-associated toxin RatA of RatAB toxin-antitoxin module
VWSNEWGVLYDSTSENTKSYNQIAVNIKSSHEVDITRQGVDQRFNTGARKYIEELISEQLSHGVSKSLEVGWFKEFNQVKVKDSTKFDLPKNLKKDLPGFGGSASEAGVSITIRI